MIFRIELGSKVKDIVSGFGGIVIGRVEYFNGCIQYLVVPKVDKEGKKSEAYWIDEPQLKVVKGGIKRTDGDEGKIDRNGGSSDKSPKSHGMVEH